MSHSALAAGVRHLRRAMAAQRHRDEGDEQLLRAFIDCREDSAFAALVRRHGPMVMGVCRRVLGHQQDAEDAFQATFLVLARNAAALHKKTALAGFLHGTAYRTALAAKRAAARRRKHERQAPVRQVDDPSGELLWREVRALLDEEIARLPEKYRNVFVLCCLENLSQAEAGRRLGLKERTVSNRLAEARKRLQVRLSRRGVELTALLTATALTTETASALPAGLMTATIKAALATAAGEGLAGAVSASVAELVEGAKAAMMVSKAKMATVVLLAVSLLTVATSGSLVFLYGRASEPLVFLYGRASEPLAATPADPPAAKATDKPRSRTLGLRPRESVEVRGRVLDPDGKLVAGAKVVLHQRRPNQELPDFFPAPATGATDADGRFRFSGNVHFNAPIRDYPPMLTLTAHVPGFGPAAVETNSPDELKDRTLRLVKDDVPLRGRILNLEGRPVAGVTVRPIAVVANAANDLGRLIETLETNKNIWADLPNDWRPNIVFSAAAAGLTQTAKTDNEGKFSLSGFGRERIVVLRLDGPAIETCLLNAMTRKGPTVRASRPRPNYDGGLMPPKPLHPPPATYVYTHGNRHFSLMPTAKRGFLSVTLGRIER